MPKKLFLLFFLSASLVSTPASAQPILNSYIRTGLDSNLALHQKNIDWEKAILSLRRSESLFYPQVAFSSQYTLANGGRSSDIPIGDLLNNVYSTLNTLTASNKFPQVANQSIKFLPDDYHDTKMEFTLPVLNPDLRYNRQVNAEMINARRADVDIYRRDLVQHIQQAYYRYLQAGKAVEIYTEALRLSKENLRVSGKLVENSMATKEVVLRARTQVSQVQSSLIEAGNNLRNAMAYFNFLLNRSLNETVIVDSSILTAPLPLAASSPATGADRSSELPANREELAKLKSVQRVMSTNLKWSQSYMVPKLNAFYDIGFQGFGFHFGNNQFYQLAGLQLLWPLFKGNDNKYKIRQARLDIGAVNDQYQELTQQLTLQAQTTGNDYSSAVEALQSLSDEVQSAKETYRLTERRFAEGQALQIELIDARTQMTSAELRYSLGQLTVLSKAADLERVTASYKFQQNIN
ncbi:MAG TPA: TolC family protein [Puia sp.]|nr:TolC family protein [Puia sp.]